MKFISIIVCYIAVLKPAKSTVAMIFQLNPGKKFILSLLVLVAFTIVSGQEVGD